MPVAVIMSSRSSARCWSIPSIVWLPTMSCVPPTRNPVAAWVSQSAFVGVAGQLLEDELGKRRVAVERANDVIAIRPGGRPGQVGLVPLALAEPDDVEPVPSPALAVLGRGQQPVDERFIRPRDRSRRRRRRRRPPRELAGRPVRSNVTRRIKVAGSAAGARRQALGPRVPARMKASIGVSTQRSIGDIVGHVPRRGRNRPDRPQRPPVRPGPARAERLAGIGCAGLDPRSHRRDLLACQRPLGGHLTARQPCRPAGCHRAIPARWPPRSCPPSRRSPAGSDRGPPSFAPARDSSHTGRPGSH